VVHIEVVSFNADLIQKVFEGKLLNYNFELTVGLLASYTLVLVTVIVDNT
jgi:hypothetical protein